MDETWRAYCPSQPQQQQQQQKQEQNFSSQLLAALSSPSLKYVPRVVSE